MRWIESSNDTRHRDTGMETYCRHGNEFVCVCVCVCKALHLWFLTWECTQERVMKRKMTQERGSESKKWRTKGRSRWCCVGPPVVELGFVGCNT